MRHVTKQYSTSWSSQSLSVTLSLVVVKDKISVLALGLGLQGQVLGPAKDEKLVKDYTDTVSCH